MAFPDNIDRRISELLEIVDRDFEQNVCSTSSELLRSLLELKRLAVGESLDYIEPAVTFNVGTDWTPIPNIPATATRATIEVEAESTDIIVARFTTDELPVPPATPSVLWMLTNYESQVIDTRKEVLNFQARRSANTTACAIRVGFYG